MKQIIAIAGNKGSGKTTLIKMIQHYSTSYPLFQLKGCTYDDYCYYYQINKNTWDLRNVRSSMEHTKVLNFADALKEQIIALTGCTMKDLESQDFKDSLSPLSIKEYHSPEKIYYEPVHYLPDLVSVKIKLKQLTYRELMLYLSDDTKDSFGKDIYQKSLFNKHDPSKHLIIGDLRYSKNTPENEEGEIKKRGGIIVKLIRPNLEGDFSHSSENSIKDIEADFEHVNEHLEDLFNLAKHLTTFLI